MKPAIVLWLAVASLLSAQPADEAESKRQRALSVQYAEQLYPDSMDRTSPLGSEIARLVEELKQTNDPILYSAHAPMVIALLARKNLLMLQPALQTRPPTVGFTGRVTDFPPPPPPVDVVAKLSALVIPVISMKDATVKECTDFIEQQCRAIDPSMTWFHVTMSAAAKPFAADTRISLSVANIPAWEALKYVSSLTNLNLQVMPDGVMLVALAEIRMVQKQYPHVLPIFFGVLVPTTDQQCQAYLKEQGIGFPAGSSAHFDSTANALTVRDTPEELDLLDTLVGIWQKGRGR